jgi:hypothetical protein
MDQQDQSFDQRKSFRCAVAGSQQTAELRVRRRRWQVQLFNESSGGFGALSAEAPTLVVGDVARLSCAQGEFEVRVAYVRRHVSDGGDSPGEQPLYRIGLERLHDVTEMQGAAAGFRDLRARRFGIGGALVAGGLTVCLLGAVAGAVAVASNAYHPWVRQFTRWRSGAERSDPMSADAFGSVVRQLGLTKTQERHVQNLAEETARALQEVDEYWKDEPAEERAIKQAVLVEAAKREVLRLLTPEQRSRWKMLVE